MTRVYQLYWSYEKEISTRHYQHARNIRARMDKMQVAILKRNHMRLRKTICPRGKAYWKILSLDNGM